MSTNPHEKITIIPALHGWFVSIPVISGKDGLIHDLEDEPVSAWPINEYRSERRGDVIFSADPINSGERAHWLLRHAEPQMLAIRP